MDGSGILAAGESSAALIYVEGRRGVSPRQMKTILAVCMLALGIPLGAWASEAWPSAMTSVEFAIVGLVLSVRGSAGDQTYRLAHSVPSLGPPGGS